MLRGENGRVFTLFREPLTVFLEWHFFSGVSLKVLRLYQK